MRHRHRSRFLGVVDEVSLSVIVCVLANDLDRVLVRADRAICAQAIEHGANHAVGLSGESSVKLEAGVGDVAMILTKNDISVRSS